MVVYSNGMRYQTSGKHAWWTTTWERAEKRRQKAFDVELNIKKVLLEVKVVKNGS